MDYPNSGSARIGGAVVTGSVAQATPTIRIAFLRKVYAMFGAAMAVWMGTAVLVTTNTALLETAVNLFSMGFLGFLLLFGGMFFVLSLTARGSTPVALFGLGLFGVVEGFLTAPLIYVALATTQGFPVFNEAGQLMALEPSLLLAGGNIVTQAFGLTVGVFGGLSAYALTTKRDFSWLRGALWMGLFGLFAIAIMASVFGIGENIVSGWGFPLAGVLLMGGFVLYDTQKIMQRYPEDMAAMAAATLLIDFIIMFKYMLMLLMSRRD
ncbi:MAG: hypothetical protein GY747_01435 [Planctomycetes bacterium]|nr:hypothetical protein [Planctomycetota bacterium]MCP4769890.1 hypothetical protein [Planctomycetota bacterium]MCP4859730.1 hypothetical protein [Planctomycetota bacterium]